MILIQNSQSIYFDKVVDRFKEIGDTLVVDDELMGESLCNSKKKVEGIVFFELTSNALKTAELSRNERFCNPTTPIACIGSANSTQYLPLGCKIFADGEFDDLYDYINTEVRLSVLLVEDDIGICEFIRTTLSKYYSVDVANDGITGKEKIENNTYDAIVLDVMLPGIGGEELFKIAKDQSSEATIVVITAYDTHEREFSFKYDGVDAYLKKPFNSNREFRTAIIEAILKKHKSANVRLSKSVGKKIRDDKDDYMRSMSSYL